MEAEFGKEASGTLDVMFNDLDSPEEKKAICGQLEKIKYVDEVDFKVDDDDYNREGHTLYRLSCEYDRYSDEAKTILDTVKSRYGQTHDVSFGGSIFKANQPGLPLWIAAVAVALVFLIILLMASSWIEPLVMLITITVAVLINMGTYIFFPSISDTTFGIVAILQLALSMDYSIMLMNRYRQERANSEKIAAMKRSLSLSFGAISGSSLTTFAGLLALVFMSSKMGADIGIALAKGVIISLICIFTVLQALIIAFDELMLKTPKKTLSFHYPRLSRFQYRFRIPITILFVLIFIFTFIAKDNVDYTYSREDQTEVEKVFGYDNSIVMVYNTADGPKADKLADELKDYNAVNSATCYEGTLGKERTAGDMHSFIQDMTEEGGGASSGSRSPDIDPDMIRLVYYDCYAGDRKIKLTISGFVSFLQNEVFADEKYSDSIDCAAREKTGKLAKITDRKKLLRSMNSRELAGFFGMKESQVRQLLLYYETKRGKADAGSMTLPQFIGFILEDVSKDKTYGKMFDKAVIQQLEALRIYTDARQMTAPVDYKTAAAYLGMDEASMFGIYTVYFAGGSEDPATAAVSIQNIVNFMITDETVGTMLPPEQLNNLQTVAGVINLSVSGKKMSSGQMAKAMGMKASDVRNIYLLYSYRSGQTGKWKISPHKFINFMVCDVLKDKSMKKKIGSAAGELRRAQTVINSAVAGTEYTAEKMADLFTDLEGGIDRNSINLVYTLYGARHMYDDSWKMDICSMISYLDDKMLQDPTFSSAIEASQKKDVHSMRKDLDAAAEQLEGEDYGRMLISADLREDSNATRAFMDKLTAAADEQFSSECYFIGNTPMAYEMSKTFKKELNKITIITALFIFTIVLLTFRKPATPFILVLLIQCAVYVTMGILTLINFDMFYLALIIVQSIMMGATIDYGIIFTTYYLEQRQKLPREDSIREAFHGSMQTILTSSTILIVAVGILSFAFSEVATRQICRILSTGCLTATVLVIFILPAVLACLDRLVIGKNTSKIKS